MVNKINSNIIEKCLLCHFGNYEYKLFNFYMFNSESDFFCVSTSGYVVEVEIKISKSDFKNDFKKTLSSGVNKHQNLKSSATYKPNKFYFAVPEGLIKKEDVPDYAGLIYVKSSATSYVVKEAKFLHKTKHFENIRFVKRLMNKYYYQNQDLKRILELRETDLRTGQKRIDFNVF